MPVGHILTFDLDFGETVFLENSNRPCHAQVYCGNDNKNSIKSEDSNLICRKVDRKFI